MENHTNSHHTLPRKREKERRNKKHAHLGSRVIEEMGDVETRGHEELLPLPPPDVVPVEGRVLVDAPEALGAPGPDRVGPEEPVAVRVDVEVAPPHRECQVGEVEPVRAVGGQRVQRVPLMRHLAHEPHGHLPVVRKRHLHLREQIPLSHHRQQEDDQRCCRHPRLSHGNHDDRRWVERGEMGEIFLWRDGGGECDLFVEGLWFFFCFCFCVWFEKV